MRLDRFLAKKSGNLGKKAIKLLLIRKRVRVNGCIITDGVFDVSEFCEICLDEKVLQSKDAYYVMLHKPQGCVSATSDTKHPTVLDLIDEDIRGELHIGGRLDFNTTGLMLLTNDGNWSRRITEPSLRKPKVYRVETEKPITEEYSELFSKGVYFEYENITTQPAELQILGEREARLTIFEGRYHQVKRMFWRFDNRLVSLHRESMGEIILDSKLAPGAYRFLTAEEIAAV